MLLLNVILIPYVFLSILFTLIVVIKDKGARLEMTLLPIFYFVMHFSYGIGFSFGLFFSLTSGLKLIALTENLINKDLNKMLYKSSILVLLSSQLFTQEIPIDFLKYYSRKLQSDSE